MADRIASGNPWCVAMANLTDTNDPFLRRLNAAAPIQPAGMGRMARIFVRLRQNALIENGMIVGLSIAAAAVVLQFTELAPIESGDVMTYNGMTIYEFAREVDLDPSDPYLIALFEELCRSEDENAML